MPTYSFRNKDTQEEWTAIMSMSEREEYLENNPNIEQTISCINFSYSGPIKTDAGFRQVLKGIKNANRGANIDTGNLSEI